MHQPFTSKPISRPKGECSSNTGPPKKEAHYSVKTNTPPLKKGARKKNAMKAFAASALLVAITGVAICGVLKPSLSQEKTALAQDGKLNDELMVDNILPPNGPWLLPLLVPRYPGSPGNRKVREHIKQHFASLRGWTFESDRFSVGDTPNGRIEFENLVFSRDVNQMDEFVVLAAHYDSKFSTDEGSAADGFIGATDSAWPCALLMFLAERLSHRQAHRVGVKVVFFDGEEAMRTWRDNDSLYGSRHLAALWKGQGLLPRIKLLALFDLLGSADTRLSCLSSVTRGHYQRLRQFWLERTGNEVLMQPPRPFPGPYHSFIQDDHMPFHRLGLDQVLHLISAPFPRVWHTLRDDLSALDWQTCHDLALSVNDFLQWLLSESQ